jgi:TBC1 domain family member 6
LKKQVAEIIEVDVARSFYNMDSSKLTHKNLTNILNTYAIVNPNLDYCQGMNFIAGYLFLIFKNEGLAFAVMREIIRKHEMSTLFNTELPML